MPLDYGIRYWSNPRYWIENPKLAKPVWVNYISQEKLLEHSVISSETPTLQISSPYYLKNYVMSYELKLSQFPTFIILRLENLTYYTSPPAVRLFIERPDNKMIPLYTLSIEKPLPEEESPYVRYLSEPKRILLSGETAIAYSLSSFLLTEYNFSATPNEVMDIGYEKIIFGKPVNGSFQPLNGLYNVKVVLYSVDARDNIGKVAFVIGGRVYGLMGTDTLGRDLFQGLLFGFPVALLIGFVTSVITTVVGAVLGIVSGYVGGRVDDSIQRVADIVNNFPQLPLLILLTFIFGGKIWIIVLVLVAFGWPSLTIILRSMVLSIKNAPFVEAAVSIGASRLRIMMRHIFPQVAPYILSQMIFYTPSAILAEAGLSFLGLGDPSMPTWGQILEYGFKNGAVYLGYWWWILPPGILIVFSAVTFVLLALGLEPVVNPKLRRWR
ncbi:ABC transporter permease [Candidatus Bathyarchaeota archaeon]|nr:ABC transporter permease [Candidatus Bathyarchaeota archaeon]